jgi:PRTRC genetic system ThiF family protein
MSTHYLTPELLRGTVRVALVGCGGSGSQMLTALARLHVSLRALGHPGGLHVTTYDPDRVSEANVGRQLFAPADVGHFKASVLTTRVNLFYGLDWKDAPERFPDETSNLWHLVIGCVDTKAARRAIVATLGRGFGTRYYLDLGNDDFAGQVLLGQVGRDGPRLPHALEVFPELATGDERIDVASCSLAASLASQSLFVNQAVVTFAGNLLYTLFTNGQTDYHGVFVNLRKGIVRPIPVPQTQAPDGRRAA